MEIKEFFAPPSNEKAIEEDVVVLPSEGIADASETTEALNSSAGTNTETIQASDAQQAPVPGLSPVEAAIQAVTQDPTEGSSVAVAKVYLKVATESPTQESVDASVLEPAGVAAEEVSVMQVADAEVLYKSSEVLLPADGHINTGEGITEVLVTPQVAAAVEQDITLGGTSGVAVDMPLEGKDAKEKPAVVNNEVSEQDIQSMKGKKVMKKFGKKNFMGDVVDYDPESKWFKIVYEDGDEEDLEVGEVKPLLVAPGTLSASSKKRVHTDEGADESSKKSFKKPKKSGTPSSAKKGKGSGVKTVSISPKTPGLHGKSAKKCSVTEKTQKADSVPKSPGKSEVEDSDSPSFTTPLKSEMKSEGKSKSKSETTPKGGSGKVSRSLDLQSSTTQKVGKARMTAESSGKRKATSSGKNKGTKPPSKGAKVQKAPMSPKSATKRKAEGKELVKPTNKRSKKGVTEAKGMPSGGKIDNAGEAHHVGKPVRKDFGGTLFDGVVVKFDKKTKYYKVKYDDGDQEELELSELEPILVPESSSIDDDSDEKPAKLSSLSTLMSRDNRVVT